MKNTSLEKTFAAELAGVPPGTPIALVLAGLASTYTVIAHTASLDEFTGSEWYDLLPDGTHDGETLHPAALVTFRVDRASGFTIHGEPYEDELVPARFIPVDLERVFQVIRKTLVL